jgi:hypothetical protein
MVVVPTSHHVSLWYGYTPVDYEGWGLSLLALIGLFLLIRHPVAPVVAVRRPGLGRRQALAPTEAAMVGTVKDLWGHVRGPEQPRPPWPSAPGGLTNGAKVASPDDAPNGGPAPDAAHDRDADYERDESQGGAPAAPPMSAPGAETSPPSVGGQAGGQDLAGEQPGGGRHP